MATLYDDIPDMVRKDVGNGIELVSECSGMRIEIVMSDEKDRFRLLAPEFPGEPALVFETDDWSLMHATYGERWLRWVTTHIGLGFHPDTPAGSYTPSLADPLDRHYDAMIDFIFERVPGDPYAIGIDAWQRAGLIEEDVAPSTPAGP